MLCRLVSSPSLTYLTKKLSFSTAAPSAAEATEEGMADQPHPREAPIEQHEAAAASSTASTVPAPTAASIPAAVQVYLRMRPMNAQELATGAAPAIHVKNDNTVTAIAPEVSSPRCYYRADINCWVCWGADISVL